MLKWIVLFVGILISLIGLGGIALWVSITSKANSKAKFGDEDE